MKNQTKGLVHVTAYQGGTDGCQIVYTADPFPACWVYPGVEPEVPPSRLVPDTSVWHTARRLSSTGAPLSPVCWESSRRPVFGTQDMGLGKERLQHRCEICPPDTETVRRRMERTQRRRWSDNPLGWWRWLLSPGILCSIGTRAGWNLKEGDGSLVDTSK